MLPQNNKKGTEIRKSFKAHSCEFLLSRLYLNKVFICSHKQRANNEDPGRSATINVADASKNKVMCLNFMVAFLRYRIFNQRSVTIKDLSLSLGIFLLCGCVTTSKLVNFKTQPLILETKVQIKDLNKDESQNAKIQIVLLTDQAIRMEVTAVFGYPVASILMTPDKIQLALHTSKKYISGPFAARTLYPVFKQNINPKILWNSVHNRSPGSAELECANNEFGKPVSCTGNDGLKVTWVYESAIKRRIEIKNQRFEMIWVFKDQNVMAAAQNETFVLNKPEDYQLIQIK